MLTVLLDYLHLFLQTVSHKSGGPWPPVSTAYEIRYVWMPLLLIKSHKFCIIADVERCLLKNTTVPPLVRGCTDQTSIDRESTVYKCLFQGNYNRLQLMVDTFWTIESPRLPFTRVDKGTVRNYNVTTYPNCIPDSKSLCCQFTTELHIHVSMLLNGANVSCWADIHNSSNSYNPQRVLYSSAKLG